MTFKGNGIVWDAENNCVLFRFINGEFSTENEKIIKVLQENGYGAEEVIEDHEEAIAQNVVDYGDCTVAKLKELLNKREIKYSSKARKDELIKLIEEAD